MKKTIITLMPLLLCVLMLFGLTACGNECEHTYLSDCDEICNECGETREITIEHNYYGDCDSRCHSCGKERKATAEHSWKPATCTTLEACEECGAVKGGELLEHSYTAAGYDDHYHYQMCSVCEKPDEESKVKHVLNDEYACACGVEFTAKTENGAEIAILVNLYNSDEKLVKKLIYEGGELTGFEEYYYDENDDLAREEKYLANGTLDYYTLYEYDENGKETRREFYLGDGTPDGVILYVYNENGDVVKETYIIDDYENVTEYEYDENGILIKYSYEDFTADNHLIGYEKYDESGRIVKETITYSDGSKLIFEYDENENIIRKTEMDPDGNVVTVTEYD